MYNPIFNSGKKYPFLADNNVHKRKKEDSNGHASYICLISQLSVVHLFTLK
ncbi:hypothetical protein SAMN05443550_101197 [Pedobacter hartonius]|uniref:Uncharacterized protein n=1 Tax=Pedobacter hartonius TaxID=425514 RepID=A0A1H3WEX9_9SPHI|nr:hypothetical protein SAMN05443550_101197 [Pedobacter hartonius]